MNLTTLRRFATLPLFILLAFLASHSAAIAQTEGASTVSISKDDIAQLLSALHTALKENDTTIPIVVSLKAPSEMPAYDPKSHYAGSTNDGSVKLHVWIANDLKGPEMEQALEQSFILAVADGGYAGPNIKKLYDESAQKDARLPAGAADPYANRHKLGQMLSQMITDAQQ